MSIMIDDGWLRLCCASDSRCEHDDDCPFADRARFCPSCHRWFDGDRPDGSCYRCGTPLEARAEYWTRQDHLAGLADGYEQAAQWDAAHRNVMSSGPYPDGPEDPY